jgi:hypothetical protein
VPGGSGVRAKSRLRWYGASFSEPGAAFPRLPAAMAGPTSFRPLLWEITKKADGKHGG